MLEGVEHDPTQFLDVVLLPSLARIPTETARQIRGADRRFVRRLQLEEEALQLKWNRFRLFVFRAVETPTVHGVAEFRCHEQRLDQTVQVASHCLIDKPDKTFKTNQQV